VAEAGDLDAGSGWRTRDHTRGSLVASTFVLALPLVASSVLAGVSFQLVELAFLSRLGEAPMAAVIIVNQTLRQLVFLILMGASFGSQALIARAVGQGDRERAEHVAGQLVLLGAGFALAVALAGLCFADPLFSLSGGGESFRSHGVPYLRLVYALALGMVGVQLFSAILGGAGDTATPFLVMLLQTAVSLAAEWVLIFGKLGAPALGVQGVALGIAAGQFAGLAAALAVLFGGGSRLHLRRRHLVPDPAVLRQILRLSWPPAIQMGTNVAVTFAFLRLAGHFGQNVQAAFAIGLRLSMLAPMVGFPLATACATLVGQALGAGDVRRAWRAIGVGILATGSVMWPTAAAFLLLRGAIVGWLSDDPEVVAVGSEFLLFTAIGFLAWAFYFVFLRALQGAGDMLVPMAISLVTALALSIPLAAWLALGTSLGPTGIWTASLVATGVTTLATGARVASGRWTRRAPAALGPAA
jgi:putative MATE family efflux protein